MFVHSKATVRRLYRSEEPKEETKRVKRKIELKTDIGLDEIRTVQAKRTNKIRAERNRKIEALKKEERRLGKMRPLREESNTKEKG